MIDVYTWKTPNGRKATIMLEETGLDYTVKPVDISSGAQHEPEFLQISPNGKIPALVDLHADGGPLALFESGAMLIYLAEKSGKFLAGSGAARYQALAWLSWQIGGLGPMLGQMGFFFRQKEKNLPALERYSKESARLLHLLEARLSSSAYLGGAAYTIADIATYPWVVTALSMMAEALPEDARNLPATQAWLATIGARPAVQKGMALPS
jgi:GST-like protein